MAEQHQPIDLTTLAEVKRLLAATDFSSVDDLAPRGDLIDLGGAIDRVRATSSVPSSSAAVDDALPRRR